MVVESKRGRIEFSPVGNTAASNDKFRIHCEWNSAERESVNLDLNYLDFKSRFKIRIWIYPKEHEIRFTIENPLLDSPKGTHPDRHIILLLTKVFRSQTKRL